MPYRPEEHRRKRAKEKAKAKTETERVKALEKTDAVERGKVGKVLKQKGATKAGLSAPPQQQLQKSPYHKLGKKKGV
jgi:hypothetical protein